MVIGVDEVGRGSWAGPLLVVAAKATQTLPDGLADSKVLTRKQRERLFVEIQLACKLGEGWVTPQEIDSLGLAGALCAGVARALTALQANTRDKIIMDGKTNYCPAQYLQVSCIIDADATCPIVSAASIYAKVKRDQYMTDVAKKYPQYEFDKHVGYGTKRHQELLKMHGVCRLHRLSYKPIKALTRTV